MDQCRRLEQRIAKLKQQLLNVGELRPGSLSKQTRSWGGVYWQLSYTHGGKGHTEYVAPARLREVKRQLANYRKFRVLTQEWVELSLELCKLKLAKERQT